MAQDTSKIAIMTWHHYYNYGTSLQVAALSHFIRKHGYETSVIDYLPRKRGKTIPNETFMRDLINQRLKAFFHRPYLTQQRKLAFSAFWDVQLCLTESLNTFSELHQLNRTVDAFVCGSDQIWSPASFDDKYFLSFVNDENKMVAYAPSIGLSKIDDPDISDQMAVLINRFSHLSIREKDGQSIIKNICDKNAEVVLDPTLLLTSKEWDSLLVNCDLDKIGSKITEKYIFCYFLGESEQYVSYIKEFSKHTGLPVYTLPTTKRQYWEGKKFGKILPEETGPAEFVSYIKNAEHVMTDSFHGMVFSIIYEVRFSVFERFKKHDAQNQNSRIYHLLALTGLEEYLVDYKRKCSITDYKQSHSFKNAKAILESEREKSSMYLLNSLKCACSNGINDPVSLPSHVLAHSKILNRDMCCGCGACAAVCPSEAISIKLNDNGFYHYQLDSGKCTCCGQCIKICPFQTIDGIPIESCVGFFSACSNDKNVHKLSSSGGISYAISKKLNKEGYTVLGCNYIESAEKAYHIIIPPDRINLLHLIQGSKYIQSETFTSFSKLLEIDKAVVFGTPCQIAAVHNLLSKLNKRNNFVLVDLICHGVPSMHLWSKYINEIKKTLHVAYDEHPNIRFREKEKGWHNKCISVKTCNSSYIESEKKDNFYAFFNQSNCYMKTCYECPYREKSLADIRLGDYWGSRFRKDKKGVSMVVAISQKGYDLLSDINKNGNISMQNQDVGEYHSIQYPYNQNIPLFYNNLIEELRSNAIPLKVIRKKYCCSYEKKEKIGKMVSIIKRILYK